MAGIYLRRCCWDLAHTLNVPACVRRFLLYDCVPPERIDRGGGFSCIRDDVARRAHRSRVSIPWRGSRQRHTPQTPPPLSRALCRRSCLEPPTRMGSRPCFFGARRRRAPRWPPQLSRRSRLSPQAPRVWGVAGLARPPTATATATHPASQPPKPPHALSPRVRVADMRRRCWLLAAGSATHTHAARCIAPLAFCPASPHTRLGVVVARVHPR